MVISVVTAGSEMLGFATKPSTLACLVVCAGAHHGAQVFDAMEGEDEEERRRRTKLHDGLDPMKIVQLVTIMP